MVAVSQMGLALSEDASMGHSSDWSLPRRLLAFATTGWVGFEFGRAVAITHSLPSVLRLCCSKYAQMTRDSPASAISRGNDRGGMFAFDHACATR